MYVFDSPPPKLENVFLRLQQETNLTRKPCPYIMLQPSLSYPRNGVVPNWVQVLERLLERRRSCYTTTPAKHRQSCLPPSVIAAHTLGFFPQYSHGPLLGVRLPQWAQ